MKKTTQKKKPAPKPAAKQPTYQILRVEWHHAVSEQCFDKLEELVGMAIEAGCSPIGGAFHVPGFLCQTLASK